MVVIDDNKNLQRIADTLKADISVFDSGKTVGKARQVLVYDPDNMIKNTDHMPYIYVTTNNSLQLTTRRFGVTSPTEIHQTTTAYDIVIVASSRSKTPKSQEQLYSIIKNVKTSLEADPTFSDPANPGTDRIFTRSVVNDIPYDPETRGQLVTSATIVLTCTIGVEQGITIPGIGFLPILGITPDTDTENWQPHFNTMKILKGYAPLGSMRTVAVLVVYDREKIDSIRNLKQTRNVIIITFTDTDGTTEDHNVVISNINTNMTSVEEIKTTSIQFNIIP